MTDEKNSQELLLKEYFKNVNSNYFEDFILNLRRWIQYLWKKKLIIIIALITLPVLGFIVHKLLPQKYVATSSLVLENISGGQPSILTQIGLGANSGASGLFSSSENMVWLYKNRAMIRSALFTQDTIAGRDKLLINYFIEEDGLIKSFFKKNPVIKKRVFAATDKDEYTIQENNKVINTCIDIILSNYISSEAVEDANNIIVISVEHDDQDFAYSFINNLVSTVNDYYISTKTKKLNETIKKLEAKAADMESRFKKDIEYSATTMDAIPYPNPQMKVTLTDARKQEGDVQISNVLYAQIVQNLENSRMSLLQETPIIQVVDRPSLPLNINKIPLTKFLLIFVLAGLILVVGIIIFRKRYIDIVSQVPDVS